MVQGLVGVRESTLPALCVELSCESEGCRESVEDGFSHRVVVEKPAPGFASSRQTAFDLLYEFRRRGVTCTVPHVPAGYPRSVWVFDVVLPVGECR